MTNIELKERFSEFIHKRGGKEWISYFNTYKNYAQDILGISPIDRWMKETYPDAYKTDGTLRKDWDIKMGLKQPKPKTKKKKNKPEVIEVWEDEIVDGE